MGPAVDLDVYVDGRVEPELAYVLGNFFVGMRRVTLRAIRQAETGQMGDGLLVSAREPPRAAGRALWLKPARPVPGPGRPGQAPPSMAEAADPQWRHEHLLSALLLAYARPEAGPGGQAPTADGTVEVVGAGWIERAREGVLDALGRAGEATPGPGVVALTHDVDVVRRHGLRALRWQARNVPGAAAGGPGGWGSYLRGVARAAVGALGGRSRRVELADWYELERRLEVRSTWFFQEPEAWRGDPRNAWYGYDEPIEVAGERMSLWTFMRRLVAEGFEVGPHVGLHAAEDDARYRLAVSCLEPLLGSRISTRHHWLREAPGRAVPRMRAAGVDFECNLGRAGLDVGTCMPFWRFDPDTRGPSGVLAVPTVLMDDVVFKATGQGLDPAGAWPAYREPLEEVARRGGTVAVSFHPDRYVHVDKLGFFSELVTFLRERDMAVTTVREAGERARERLPEVRGDGD